MAQTGERWKKWIGEPVFVEWVDSVGFVGWRDKQEAMSLPMAHIHSYGLLFNVTKRGLTLAQNIDTEESGHLAGNTSSHTTIPLGAVVKVRRMVWK